LASRKASRGTSSPQTGQTGDQPGRRLPTSRTWWLAPLVVLLLVAVMFPEPLLQGRIYGSADTAASEAFRQVGDAAREAGEYPLWNPYIFGGMPSFGSLAYTVGVYPPTVAFETLQDLGAPPLTWLLGHLLFGGLGMWWLLGRWRLPWAARLVGCVGWLWFARVVAWGVHGHGSKLGAAMFMPWLLGLAWEILVRGRLRAVATASLLLGLQFLRGHVQISYYTLLVLGLVTVWSVIRPLGDAAPALLTARLRRAGLMALVLVFGFAMGAALLLPVHDYAAMSTRGAGGASGAGGSAFDYATAWSLAPEDLAAVLVPTAAGFGKATYLGRMPFTDYPNYLGPLLLLLAGLGWFTGRRQLTIMLLVTAMLATAVAMGRFSPGIYQLLYEVLPYFDKFRVPSMVMVVPALCVAVLAALGSAAVADPERLTATVLRRVALATLAVGGIWLLVGVTGIIDGPYRSRLAALAVTSGKQAASVIVDEAASLHRAFVVRQGLLLLAAGGALLLGTRRPAFRAMGMVPVLALLVAVDLGGVARLVTHPERSLMEVVRAPDGGGRLAPATRLVRPWAGPAKVQVPADLAGRLQEMVGHDRLLPLGPDINSNAYMTVGVRSLGGYHPAKPAWGEAVRQRLFTSMPAGHLARWLSAAAVTFPGVLRPEQRSALAEAGLDLATDGVPAGGTMVYPVRNKLPRARLMDAWLPTTELPGGDDVESFLDAVAVGRHDPAAAVVLDRTPDPLPERSSGPLPPPVFVRDGLNEVVLAVDASRPALLLLADPWAEGWRVEIDGRPADLLRADLSLRAVALPAGAEEVRFVYRDPAVSRGMSLAVAGIMGAMIVFFLAWRREHVVRGRSITEPEV
jgi:hypothetical protein